MSAVHALEADLDHDLLLSQRALDFLAELPGTNPGTPRAGSSGAMMSKAWLGSWLIGGWSRAS